MDLGLSGDHSLTSKSVISAVSSLWMLIASTQLCAGAQTSAIMDGAAPSPAAAPAESIAPTLREAIPANNSLGAVGGQGVLTAPIGATTGAAPIPMGTVNLTPTPGLGSQSANAPLQGTIGAIELDLSGTPLAIGPYIGVKVRVSNNTNSPILLDGDRASLEKGGASMTAVTNAAIETSADPPEPKSQIAKNAILGAVTIGAALAIHDQLVENGPVLRRFGGDEKRREATAQRFGKRIVWTGDSTEGTLFFPTSNIADINGGNIRLPIVTFPQLDIRGYVQTTAGNLPTPAPPTVPNTSTEKKRTDSNKSPKSPVEPLLRLSPP